MQTKEFSGCLEEMASEEDASTLHQDNMACYGTTPENTWRVIHLRRRTNEAVGF